MLLNGFLSPGERHIGSMPSQGQLLLPDTSLYYSKMKVTSIALLWQFSRFRRCCLRFAFPI